MSAVTETLRLEAPKSFDVPPASLPNFAGAHRPNGALTGLRILVVEDNDDSRDLMVAVLSQAGAAVAAAATVREAWCLFEVDCPDVIVSDIGLPEEDGYSFMRTLRLRGAQEGGTVPSVAVTAYSSPECRLKAKRAGFTALLAKPVSLSQLLAMVVDLGKRP